MSRYKNIFLKVLKESNLDPDLERDAMESSLDDGVDASDFDVSADDQGLGGESEMDEVSMAMARQNQQIVATLQTWITKTEEFLTFLNSENPDSIQSTLAASVPDTILDKMKQTQQTKITRVASDLASFHQSLLGFMSQTKNAKWRGV